MTTQMTVRNGCRKHAMSEAEVERWWQNAEGRAARDPEFTVGVCICCLGPCPVNSTSLCKRCSEGEA